jgi:molecular chaperone DnaJ
MKRILNLEIKEKLIFEIDSRYKIDGLIKFIRLFFNKLEIRDNYYLVYYDKENIKNYKILLNSLANFYKKHKDEISYKKILLNAKKDILIKIKKHEVTFDENAIYISVNKISSKEFEINFANPKKSVYDYIKGLFLFDILDFDEYKMIVSYNEDTRKIISALLAKKSIMGYKVVFNVKKEDFSFSRSFSVEGSLKEYLTKVRNALELFGASTIYEWDKIKKEYRRLAKKYHPDLHRNKPELIQKIYEKKFRRVKESYELLEEYYHQKATSTQ